VSSEPERHCIRVRIEGVVQGVGFRWWTQQHATNLGLDGWVRNRRDGGVEAVFAGPRDVVEKMVALCRAGPTSARVDWVNVQPEDAEPAAGFTLLPTA
jgi:acylphosphatase